MQQVPAGKWEAVVSEASGSLAALTAALIEGWEPPTSPHCSNCLGARVRGYPEAPEAYCGKGHGPPKPLWVLLRQRNARGFARAEKCPDWDRAG